MNLLEIIKSEYNKSISECTNEEIYNTLLTLVKIMAEGKQHKNSKKKLYYISAEFLIGKLLSNNLINLGIYDDIKEELAKNGKDLCEIEEFEKELQGKEKQGKKELPVLAIELDGKEHFEDAVVQERDRKKNAICQAHNMEIIRVENSYARRYNHIKGILMDYFSRVH